MEPRTLILLSDSNDKRSVASTFESGRRLCSPEFLSHDRRNKLLEKRVEVLRMLNKPEKRRLYNKDQRSPFRDLRECNRTLVKGPDFDCNESDVANGKYLPAYRRFSGRFFVSLEDECNKFWENVRKRSNAPEILFVSGLYGLLLWDEPIQDYDCYIADCLHPPGTETLEEFWREPLTDVLADFIKQGRIECVYDLLSPEAYQYIFHWKRIQTKERHRIFKDVPARDILPYLATIFSNHFDRFCKGYKGFDCDQWHSLPGEGSSTIKFGFESKLDTNKEAWREGDWNEVRQRLTTDFGQLSSQVFDHLSLAECSWQKLEALKQADFGSVVVSYSKAVESFLRTNFPAQTRTDRRGLRELSEELRAKPWSDLKPDVKKLADLRDPGAHADPRSWITDDVRQARELVLTILKCGAIIKKSLKTPRSPGQ